MKRKAEEVLIIGKYEYWWKNLFDSFEKGIDLNSAIVIYITAAIISLYPAMLSNDLMAYGPVMFIAASILSLISAPLIAVFLHWSSGILGGRGDFGKFFRIYSPILLISAVGSVAMGPFPSTFDTLTIVAYLAINFTVTYINLASVRYAMGINLLRALGAYIITKIAAGIFFAIITIIVALILHAMGAF